MRTFEKQWAAMNITQLSATETPFTETEKRCVILGGLMHDTGHGIGSHLFDRSVMKAILDSQVS